MDVPRPMPLGQLVVQRGLVTEEQLEIALAEHTSTGKPLGEVLVDGGWITARHLAELLAQQDGARGIELLRARVAEAEAELDPDAGGPDDSSHPGHVLFVGTPSGYELLVRAGDPPAVGDEVGVSGGLRIVMKVGPSPLPGDLRRCAFLDEPS